MKGERLLMVRKKGRGNWPDYYIMTDRGIYLTSASCFKKIGRLPLFTKEVMSFGATIEEIRGDGEDTALLLSNGQMLVIGISGCATGEGIVSSLSCELQEPDAAASWKEEFEKMPELEIES